MSYGSVLSKGKTTEGSTQMILNPVTDPLPFGIWNENEQIKETKRQYDDFTKTRAYEVGYRINPMTPGLAVMSYSKFGDEIFEFGSTAFNAPEGAVRSNYQEYKNFIDNPDPSNDFIDAVVPQTLKDPLINLPSFFPTNPPFLPPPRNDSFIAPMPFIDFDPEKKTSNLPIIIGLLLLGFFIIK